MDRHFTGDRIHILIMVTSGSSGNSVYISTRLQGTTHIIRLSATSCDTKFYKHVTGVDRVFLLRSRPPILKLFMLKGNIGYSFTFSAKY